MNHGLLSFGNSNFNGFDGLKLANVKTRVSRLIKPHTLWLPLNIETVEQEAKVSIKGFKSTDKIKVSINCMGLTNGGSYHYYARLYRDGKEIALFQRPGVGTEGVVREQARFEFIDTPGKGPVEYSFTFTANIGGLNLYFGKNVPRATTASAESYMIAEVL